MLTKNPTTIPLKYTFYVPYGILTDSLCAVAPQENEEGPWITFVIGERASLPLQNPQRAAAQMFYIQRTVTSSCEM